MSDQRSNIVRISPLSVIIMLVVLLVIIYMLFRGLMALASWAMPVLLIATLIIDYKVYPRYIRYVLGLYQRSIGLGIVATLLTVFLFPLVILMLFSQALLGWWLGNKVKGNPVFQDPRQARESEYVEYEEVEDVDLSEPEGIELPPVEPKPKDRNRYDDFF